MFLAASRAFPSIYYLGIKTFAATVDRTWASSNDLRAWSSPLERQTTWLQNTQLLCKAKYNCMVNFLFDWFVFDQTSKYVSNSRWQAKQLNPNQSIKRSVIQSYFSMWSKWVLWLDDSSTSLPLTSVMRLCSFCKMLATNFASKVAQVFCDFLGQFEKCCFLSKFCCCYWKNRPTL